MVSQEAGDEVSADAEQERPTTSLTVADVLLDFDAAWRFVSDTFYDTEFQGIDWSTIRDDYRSRLQESDDAIEAFDILREMIDALESSTTVVLPPWDVSPSEDNGSDFELEYGGVGILLRQTADGEILVLQVFSGTPAETAGVLLGDLIVGVDEWAVGGDDPMEGVVGRVRGIVGTTVNLTLRDPDGAERTVEIARAQIDLTPAVEHRTLSQSTGYLRIPILNERLVQDASRALPQLLSTRNMILDLRGVRSGGLEQVTTIAQWFLGSAQMGGFLTRGGAQPLPSRTDAVAAYQRPMVILTDRSTSGVAEMLASLLRTYKRAGLVGGTTSGGFELSRVEPLPSGGLVGVAVARFIAPDGTLPPLSGLTPDVEVEIPDLETLRAGRDVYIETAIETLQGSPRW
ncbi:MAG: S41 family peptidase [Spirochaetia bacterium]